MAGRWSGDMSEAIMCDRGRCRKATTRVSIRLQILDEGRVVTDWDACSVHCAEKLLQSKEFTQMLNVSEAPDADA